MSSVTALAVPEEPEESRRSGRRNVNGEGTIRQRADGRWEGRAYVVTSDGREIRRSVYGHTWEEAHEKLTRLQAARMNGARVPVGGMTVGDYLLHWLREIVRDRLRDTTYRSYETVILVHLVPVLGRKKLASLQPSDIRAAFNRLKTVCRCCALGKDAAREERAQHTRAARTRPRKNARVIPGARCCAKTPPECCGEFLADGTIRYAHRVLRVALQDAFLEGLVTQNVAKNLRLNHRYRPHFTPWTSGEAREFLEAARGGRLYALYVLALMLGLRKGELLGLRWSDIDLDRGVLRVRTSLQRVNGQLRLGPVKTDSSARVVAMSASCVRVLRGHKERQDTERDAAGRTWTDHDLVFASARGTPLEPRNVTRQFDALCRRAGLRRIRFHDLRHTCATLLYEQGVTIDNIQNVLGHSSPTITKMIYVEVTEIIQRGAADRLDHLFPDGD